MDRRNNERIPMRLPCVLSFSADWGSAFTGVTANMHRNGMLISCAANQLPRVLPRAGARCTVQVELPSNHSFGKKCVVCETTVIRVDEGDEQIETRFAMRIESVAFRDLDPEAVHLETLQRYSSDMIV